MSCIKRIFIVILITVQFISVLPCAVNASTVSKAKHAYKKYVSEHKKSGSYMYGQKNPDYKIVDVNGDKVPELLFINRVDYKAEVWTFLGGKMRCMYKEGYGKIASFAYKKSKHQVAVLGMHTSGYVMSVYKAKKTKLKSTKTVLENGDAYRIGYSGDESMRGTYVYLINGKRVSKKKFTKTWNKYKFSDPYWKMK